MIIYTVKQNNAITSGYAVRVINLDGCMTGERIFKAFKTTLSFDEGFGENWNAFHDSILNLCFTVDCGLSMVLLHADSIFCLEQFEQEYLIHDLFDMVDGMATQDDGNTLKVCLQFTFDSDEKAKNFPEIVSKLRLDHFIISKEVKCE